MPQSRQVYRRCVNSTSASRVVPPRLSHASHLSTCHLDRADHQRVFQVVLIGSMGGTDPSNRLNSLGNGEKRQLCYSASPHMTGT